MEAIANSPRLVVDSMRRLALEVARGARHVLYTGFHSVHGKSGTIKLDRMELLRFDAQYKNEMPRGEARKMARRLLSADNYKLTDDCAEVLIDVLRLTPEESSKISNDQADDNKVLCIDVDGNYLGAFESVRDAILLHRMQTKPRHYINKALRLKVLTEGALRTLKSEVAPNTKLRGHQLLEELFIMAAKKAVTKKAVKKVAKVMRERAKKTGEGPLHAIRKYVERNVERFKSGKLTRKMARAVLIDDMGLSPGTVGVQLSVLLKAAGVAPGRSASPTKAKRGAAKKTAKRAATKKPAKKAAAKKVAKKVAKKAAVKKLAKKAATRKAATKKPAAKKATATVTPIRRAPKKKVAAVQAPAAHPPAIAEEPPSDSATVAESNIDTSGSDNGTSEAA